jgi:hypothetical protein
MVAIVTIIFMLLCGVCKTKKPPGISRGAFLQFLQCQAYTGTSEEAATTAADMAIMNVIMGKVYNFLWELWRGAKCKVEQSVTLYGKWLILIHEWLAVNGNHVPPAIQVVNTHT